MQKNVGVCKNCVAKFHNVSLFAGSGNKTHPQHPQINLPKKTTKQPHFFTVRTLLTSFSSLKGKRPQSKSQGVCHFWILSATFHGDGVSKVVNQHTELEHTPKRNLYQQAILAGIPFIVGERGIGWGVF